MKENTSVDFSLFRHWYFENSHFSTHSEKNDNYIWFMFLHIMFEFLFTFHSHFAEAICTNSALELCHLASSHKSISSIHLLFSSLGEDSVSLSWDSELLTNWPIMGIMDATVSCLPRSNLQVKPKAFLFRILNSEDSLAATNGVARTSALSQWINK